MREQHSAIVNDSSAPAASVKKVEKIPYAIVTIAMGEGIAQLLRSIGASYVIEGGQTMNPSTEDIVKAVKESGERRFMERPRVDDSLGMATGGISESATLIHRFPLCALACL